MTNDATSASGISDDGRMKLLDHFHRAIAQWDRLARRAQIVSSVLRILEVWIAAAIPILLMINASRLLIEVPSVLLCLLLMSSQLWQFDLKWRHYRYATDRLKQLLFEFELQSPEQDRKEELKRFIDLEREFRAIADSDFSRWLGSLELERAK